jgi:uncharacterized membrane protein
MKKLLTFAAIGELATGVALLAVPSLVGRLLVGAEITGVAVPIARVFGIALIALGIACLPGLALAGMLTYGALVALYLAYLGIAGGFTGVLLWPAVGLHLVLTFLLAGAWRKAHNKESCGRNSRDEPHKNPGCCQ